MNISTMRMIISKSGSFYESFDGIRSYGTKNADTTIYMSYNILNLTGGKGRDLRKS